jgi:hypothetical protein
MDSGSARDGVLWQKACRMNTSGNVISLRVIWNPSGMVRKSHEF